MNIRAAVGRSPRFGEIYIARIDLAVAGALPASVLEPLAAILEAGERVRADRFIFPEDRARFIVSHAALRHCLAEAIGCAPEQLRFEYGPFGKPALQAGSRGAELCFNMAHTKSLALVAWADADLGIDVEAISHAVDDVGVARRVFSCREQDELAALPAGEERRAAFFALWTRKEAVLKALGTGFSREASEIDLGLAPPPEGVWTWVDEASGRRFIVMNLDVGSGYKAALALSARSLHGEDGAVACRSNGSDENFKIIGTPRELPRIFWLTTDFGRHNRLRTWEAGGATTHPS